MYHFYEFRPTITIHTLVFSKCIFQSGLSITIILHKRAMQVLVLRDKYGFLCVLILNCVSFAVPQPRCTKFGVCFYCPLGCAINIKSVAVDDKILENTCQPGHVTVKRCLAPAPMAQV